MKCNVKECKKDHEIYDASTLTHEEIVTLDASVHHLLKEGFAGATEDSTTIKEWYYPLTTTAHEGRAEEFESEEEEKYHCIRCEKKIPEEEYLENTGLCDHCVQG
jgi:hypothetical protein